MIMLRLVRIYRRIRHRRLLGVGLVVLLVLICILGNSVCFYVFDGRANEDLTFADALWYSVISITTIGYGDYRASSLGARIGHMSAFMAQAGNLIVLGNAGDSFGDSIYEARLFVRGETDGLGADCVEKELREEHVEFLGRRLRDAGFDTDPASFRRFGSARRLYNFHPDDVDALVREDAR